jgi:hypothetical protein
MKMKTLVLFLILFRTHALSAETKSLHLIGVVPYRTPYLFTYTTDGALTIDPQQEPAVHVQLKVLKSRSPAAQNKGRKLSAKETISESSIVSVEAP